jgi:tetratricopeptide (TPR) repeat protein
MYELAIEDDPVNSALHDRFSWLLLNKTEFYEYAEKISKKAIELDNNNCDAIVGIALVYYRLGNIPEGDNYIDQAGLKGRTDSFCNLRKAIARYHKEQSEIDINEKILLLEDALEKLEHAEKRNKNNGGYDAKNRSDITKYQDLSRAKLSTLRAKRTRMINTTKLE